MFNTVHCDFSPFNNHLINNKIISVLVYHPVFFFFGILFAFSFQAYFHAVALLENLTTEQESHLNPDPDYQQFCLLLQSFQFFNIISDIYRKFQYLCKDNFKVLFCRFCAILALVLVRYALPCTRRSDVTMRPPPVVLARA